MRISTSHFTEDAAFKKATSVPSDKKPRFNWSEARPDDRFAGAPGALTVATGAARR